MIGQSQRTPVKGERPPNGESDLHLAFSDDQLPRLGEAVAEAPQPTLEQNIGATALHNQLLTPDKLPADFTNVIEQCIDRSERADRSKEIYRLSRNEKTFEVTVESDITLEHIKQQTPEKDWNLLESYMTQFKQDLDQRPEGHRAIVFINPTMEGGGVAMMRPPLVHLMKLFGIDARWYVMEGPNEAKGEPNVFKFTKQMHNLIQRRVPDRITEEGKAMHKKWAVEKNGAVLIRQPEIRHAAGVILDDPQTSPLARLIKKVNPDVALGWRNHIDNDNDLMMDPTTPQGEVHHYLQEELGLRELADFFVYHPDIKNNFIPSDNREKSYVAPATVEPNDDMNRELKDEEISDGIADVNTQIAAKNQNAINEGRFDDVQEQVDLARDRIVLIARFDESKGMDQAMELGARVREDLIQKYAAEGIDRELPQLILIGNGSGDDPSGDPIEKEMLKLRREKYGHMKQDIIVQRLLHNYVAINAMMYNQNPDTALVALQMSTAEGCETRIGDWINHGIPAAVANVGGMPLQIREGESGLILGTNSDQGRHERPNEVAESELNYAAAAISDLIIDRDSYKGLRETTFAASKEFNKREYTTTANVTRFARMFHRTFNGLTPDKVWKIQDMIDMAEAQAETYPEELAA